MSHPLVLALFPTAAAAAGAARALHEIGIARDQISVVARNHEEQGVLARALDASPGADIEDSRPAAVLGELGAQVLAAIALVMPGIGPIVTAGPLSAGLGEAAGHVAGGVASVLRSAGVPEPRAEQFQREVEQGALLIGVHTTETQVSLVRNALAGSGATQIELAIWDRVD